MNLDAVSLSLFNIIKNRSIKYSLEIHLWTFKNYCSSIRPQKLESWLQITCTSLSFRFLNILLPLVSIYSQDSEVQRAVRNFYQLSSLNSLVLKGRKLISPESHIIRPRLLWTWDQEEGHGGMRLGEKEPLLFPMQGIRRQRHPKKTDNVVTVKMPVNWESLLLIIPVIFHRLPSVNCTGAWQSSLLLRLELTLWQMFRSLFPGGMLMQAALPDAK